MLFILICETQSPPPDEPAIDEDDITNESFWALANGEVSSRYKTIVCMDYKTKQSINHLTVVSYSVLSNWIFSHK